MVDRYGRTIDYMRISVTERCNYRCFYCMPYGYSDEGKEKNLSSFEIIGVVEAAVKLGVKKIRITGGEPLVRGDIEDILCGISQVEGVQELCITTNGSTLYERADLLKRCGVHRINVSLDTLREERFERITRGGSYARVWKGIEKALELGIEVRINTVMVEGINDDEIEDIADITMRYPIDVRYIELMPIGEGRKYRGVSQERIRGRLAKEYRLVNSGSREGASEYYTLEGALGRIGFINPMTNCFCNECNRIRVTAKGDLKQCLNRKSTANLRESLAMGNREVEKILREEIYNKPEKHLFNEENEYEEAVNMNKIGG